MSGGAPGKKKSQADSARAAEVDGTSTVEVEWRTLTPFRVPVHYLDLPFEAVLAGEQGNDAALLAALLPGPVLAEFRAMGCTVREARELLDQIALARGFADAGESAASTA